MISSSALHFQPWLGSAVSKPPQNFRHVRHTRDQWAKTCSETAHRAMEVFHHGGIIMINHQVHIASLRYSKFHQESSYHDTWKVAPHAQHELDLLLAWLVAHTETWGACLEYISGVFIMRQRIHEDYEVVLRICPHGRKNEHAILLELGNGRPEHWYLLLRIFERIAELAFSEQSTPRSCDLLSLLVHGRALNDGIDPGAFTIDSFAHFTYAPWSVTYLSPDLGGE